MCLFYVCLLYSYQDFRAFNGGDDGIIKPLLQHAAKVLKPGGRLFLEVDPIVPEQIRSFLNKYSDLKLRYEQAGKDLLRNDDRFVEILKI